VSPEDWTRAQNDLRTRALIETLYRYSDGQQSPWIHLMDGGISDNLALRVLLNDMLLLDTRGDRFAADLMRVRRILVISVDGQSAPNPNWPRQRIVSGLGQVLSAVSSAQIGAYNIETLIALQSAVDDLVDKLRTRRCRQAPVIGGFACGDVEGRVLQVSLSDYPDPETRSRLVAIRTGLTLPREQVDDLVAAGEKMIGRDAGAIAGFLEPGPQAAVMARRR
jgi:NTE family protein